MTFKPNPSEVEPLDRKSVLSLSDTIEYLYEIKPSKKEKQNYETWKGKINEYIKECNKLSKFKMYEIVK